MEKAKFILKGLTCGNCAGKIERDANKQKNIESAEINLIKQEISIVYSGEREDIFAFVKKVTRKYEPDVVVEDMEYGVIKEYENGEKESCAGGSGEIVIDDDCEKTVSKNDVNSGKEIEIDNDCMRGKTASEIFVDDCGSKEHLMGSSCASNSYTSGHRGSGEIAEGCDCGKTESKNDVNNGKETKKDNDCVSKKTAHESCVDGCIGEEHLANSSGENYSHISEHGRNSCNSKEHTHEGGESCCCGNVLNSNGKQEQKDENKNMIKNKIIKFSIGIGFFIFALLANEGSLIKILFFIVSYLVLGYEVLLRSVKNISRGQVFDENFLMSISTLGAIAIGEMPEAVFVMLFYQVGETFQELAVEKSRKSIRSLMDIRPEVVNLIVNEEIIQIKPENVKIGDIIGVKPGERVPLDGIVVEGNSHLDTSALTGESMPRSVKEGISVLSGVINVSGFLKIRVTEAFANSTVVKILELTENATAKKTKTEQFITNFARIYTPVVVMAAVVLAFVPPTITPEKDLIEWVSRALIFLVISCPCALVLSVPLGFFSGIGEASRNGVLFKGSNYLQGLCTIDTVVLDKTGTVTEGVFEITEINPFNISEKELLKIAAYVEKMSNHPIAKSVVEAFEKKEDIKIEKIENYEELSGYGVSAVIDKRKVFAGNNKMMQSIGTVDYKEFSGIGSVVYLADEKDYLGYIVVSDKIKKDSKEAIEKIKKAGVKEVIMLTGDSRKNGEEVGRIVGVDRVESELLPTDKVEKIEEIYASRNGAKILFVGDGINDAPVLSRVEVGVAMGGVGSDAAIEAADMVIMNDSLLKIPDAFVIARNTNKIVKQNIVFALGVKAIVLALGALGYVGMGTAIFADVGVSVIAILNSMRKKMK